MIFSNIELLNEVIDRDNAQINFDINNIKLNANTQIYFICSCGKEGNKILKKLNINGGAFCKTCTKSNTVNKKKETCLEKYGVDHQTKTKEVIEKMKQTTLKNLGVENASQSQIIKDKKISASQLKYNCDNVSQAQEVKNIKSNLSLKKYGYKHVVQAPEVKAKIKITMLKKYNYENPSQVEMFKKKKEKTSMLNWGVAQPLQSEIVREKGIKTCLEKYNYENPSQVEIFKKKKEETSMLNWGVTHRMKDPDFAATVLQNSKIYNMKIFTWPSGYESIVQGYEPFALQKLLNLGYNENQIITERSKVPKIIYEYNEKNRRYYVDIYIPSENKVIEIKSDWTLKVDKDRIYCKGNACKSNGYIFVLWVFDKKGALIAEEIF